MSNGQYAKATGGAGKAAPVQGVNIKFDPRVTPSWHCPGCGGWVFLPAARFFKPSLLLLPVGATDRGQQFAGWFCTRCGGVFAENQFVEMSVEERTAMLAQWQEQIEEAMRQQTAQQANAGEEGRGHD